jgi:predicted  nucleic acid-binding Zn-ribbon protein
MLNAVQHGYSRYRKFKARASTHLVFIVRCEETMKFADPTSPNESITKKGHSAAIFALVVGRPTAFFRCADSAFQRDKGENEKAKVPFREASLTRLLQDFFGGNTFAYTFACVAPHHSTSKDAVVVLELAAKLEVIRTKPRITYDETTTEFRRLDEEVNTLATELSAAKEAHEIIQEELSARQATLDESRKVYHEQDAALNELRDATASEEIVVAVRRMRLVQREALDKSSERALRDNISSAGMKAEELQSEIASLETNAAAAQLAVASAVAAAEGLDARGSVAAAEIRRQEKRYAEVAASKNGLGAIKVQVENDHTARVGSKKADAETKRAEAADLRKHSDEMAKPIRITQMAADSLDALRKRVQAAKERKAALDKEAAALPNEIASLEKEVEQMEKDAAPEPSCCTVM